MKHETPTIYVWFAENNGTESNGEQFIRAWTHDLARVDGLRNAIGTDPTIYSANPTPSTAAPAARNAGLTDEQRNEFAERMVFVNKATGLGIVDDIVRALLAAPEALPAEHSAIYISKRLTGSDADASFVQAHINQAVSEAIEALSSDAPVAWLVTSKRGMVRCTWTERPSKEQLMVSEYDGDTITPLFASPVAPPVADSVQAATHDAPSADEVDAQRYRWLREDRELDGNSLWIARGDGTFISRWTGESVDEMIDKAIAASAPKEST